MAAPTGVIENIRSLLKNGDMTTREMADALRVTPRTISNAIQGHRRNGGIPIYVVGKKPRDRNVRQPIYSLKAPVKELREKSHHPERYVPQFKPLEPQTYDLWASRNLAMLAR